MEKTEYEEKMKKLPEENQKVIREAQEKYGDYYWWLSGNPVEIAMNQLFEDVLLVDFGTFHKGVEELLGRPVWTHEFGLNMEGLREEAGRAMRGLTNEERDDNMRRGLETLVDHCERTGKKLFFVDMRILRKYEEGKE